MLDRRISMKRNGWREAVPLLAFLVLGSVHPAVAGGSDASGGQSVQVPTLSPTRGSVARSTTQPATLHAYFEARLFTKVSGYLEKLNVDIGDSVSKGDVLAEVAVPELLTQRLAKQAGIRRLQRPGPGPRTPCWG